MRKKAESHKGQTFIEFIFLMLVIMGLSFILVRGFGSGITQRWVLLVKIIAGPTDTNISL